jgi:nicotinamide-nucleotide amidase
MPSAEIIAIGTELLLGEIIDTNTPYLARAMRDLGIDVYRNTSVGDNIQRIAQILQECLQRCDIIITTGGLGPTVDDPTRDAVALAAGVASEYRPELWDQIQARFQRYGRQPTENNRRQAFIPQGAMAVENPVGTAPAFMLEKAGKVIICLPGVPREMEYLVQNAVIPSLRQRFNLHGIIKARTIHTAGVGESQIDEMVGDLEELSNPTIGLLAHSGQVDVRITVKAESETEADQKIAELEVEVRKRLGDMIYGVDQETLEGVVYAALKGKGWELSVLEAGLNGELTRRLAQMPALFLGGKIISEQVGPDQLKELTISDRQFRGSQVELGISIIPGIEKQEIYIVLITPDQEQLLYRPYGGAPGNASRWAVNHALNVLRKL